MSIINQPNFNNNNNNIDHYNNDKFKYSNKNKDGENDNFEDIPNSNADSLNNCANSNSNTNGNDILNNLSENGDRKLYSGKCKWFNVAKGWGFIHPDHPELEEVFVHQSVIKMPGFRSLGDEEPVEFEYKITDKGLEATLVTGPSQSDCIGSNRRPKINQSKGNSKKRKGSNGGRLSKKKIRCYNCGELAHHIASKCVLTPQPKRCHSCKSEDHLIKECPLRTSKEIAEEEEAEAEDENMQRSRSGNETESD